MCFVLSYLVTWRLKSSGEVFETCLNVGGWLGRGRGCIKIPFKIRSILK